MKKNIKRIGLLLGLLTVMCLPVALMAPPVSAAIVSCPALGGTKVDEETCKEATENQQQFVEGQNPDEFDLGRDTNSSGKILGITCDNDSSNLEDQCIYAFAVAIVNWLAAGVGVAVIGGIVYGGIMYATAGGSPERTKQGISIITNALIALFTFFLMWAAINFLIPGGLFK